MWNKKKLEIFVVLSIITSAALTTARIMAFKEYRAGSLVMLLSSFVKTVLSYSNTHNFDFKIRYVLLVASFSFIGMFLGVFAYYHNASSVSYVISSNLQYLFIALVSIAWFGVRYRFLQYLGLLMILAGFFIEISLSNSSLEVPVHTFLGALSGLFNAASLITFDSVVRPALVNFECFWEYMTAYGVYLTYLSSFYFVQETLSNKQNYLGIMKSPILYTVILLEVSMTYLLSKVSVFLDSVERKTLFNVSTGFSAVVADVCLFHEIDARRFLGFISVVIGAQLFIFFRKKE